MYLDSAYIAKFYVNEPDAAAVRKLIGQASHTCSSWWGFLEVTCVFHRHIREGALTNAQGTELIDLFRSHVEIHIWNFLPVTDTILKITATLVRGLPASMPLRAGDAIHVATALDAGEPEIWTNDRHLLTAATYFGLKGRSVGRS